MGDDARIWVGGLPDGLQEHEIEREFGRLGPVKDVQIRTNRGGPSFAFVQYKDRRDAEEAVSKFNQARMFGQPFVKVSWAGKPKGPPRHEEDDRRFDRGPPRRDSRSPPPRYRSRSPRHRDERGGNDRGREEWREERDRPRYYEDRRYDRRDDRDPPRYRDRSPPYRGRSGSPPFRGDGRPPSRTSQGQFRIQIENLPSDMGWQKLKELGQSLVKRGQCTFSRTRRDRTGVLEFTSVDDMKLAIHELDGRRLTGSESRLVVYEERGNN